MEKLAIVIVFKTSCLVKGHGLQAKFFGIQGLVNVMVFTVSCLV